MMESRPEDVVPSSNRGPDMRTKINNKRKWTDLIREVQVLYNFSLIADSSFCKGSLPTP